MALLNDTENNNQVLFEGNLCVKKVILNRPRKLNSLTYEMFSQILKKMKAYENDFTVKLVIMKGNGKAFCAGGDVVALYNYTTGGHWSFSASYYKKKVILDYFLATYKKPLVALMDGRVMGAGAGLSMYATFRIATEKTVFAIPEASIGQSASGAAPHFLSTLPGYFGEYLGHTGARLDGAEMVAYGLATHFVLSKDIHLLEDALMEVASSDITTISELISKFSHQINVKEDIVYNRLRIVNKCFSRETVEDILLALREQVQNGDDEKWIVDAIKAMKAACPTSLKIFLRSMRESRDQNLEQSIVREYTIGCHIARGTVSNNFHEGVRAMVLEQDKKPKWQPSKLELVTEEIVDMYFRKVDDDDWEFLQLPPRFYLLEHGRSKI